MPLTPKGEKIMKSMVEEYGPEKGKEVFYASANKGTITGVHDDPSDDRRMDDRRHDDKPVDDKRQDDRRMDDRRHGHDVTQPLPASGPMSTKGPNPKSEGLPSTTEPFQKDSKEVGKAMSLDEIKSQGKRIGRY